MFGNFHLAIRAWGKWGCIIKLEMRRNREFVVGELVADGYTVIDAADWDSSGVF
ncbi:hypothetical protein [Nostoc sp. NZL]|uniref:hypothetical protein n=1 Tax=Nostoc sp. NZL TaxID=2650612 RepID=UPI0018C72A3E|nr:hypothetical protein [Nostoc sp. NZL]